MIDLINQNIHSFGNSSALWTIVKYEKQRDGANMQYRFYYKIYVSNRSGVANSNGYYSQPLKATFNLDGNEVWTKTTQSGNKGWSFEYTSDWITVPNKTSGTTLFTLKIIDTIGGSGGSANYSSGAKYLEIDPAGSELNDIFPFNIGETFNVKITKYTSKYDVLVIKIGDTFIKTYNEALAIQPITFTTSELNTIYDLTPKATQTFTFELTTYEDETKETVVGITKQKTATGNVINSNPLITQHYFWDANSNIREILTSNSTVQVLNASKTEANVYVSAQNNATIKSVTFNGVLGTFNNGRYYAMFDKPTTNIYKIIVTDSRDFITEQTITATKIDYIEPTLKLNLFERNEPTDGKINVSYAGKYFNGSFGKQDNSLTISYRYRQYGQIDYSSWINLVPVIATDNTFSQNATLSGFDYSKQYEFQFKAVDKINTRIVDNAIISKGIPVYNWDDDNFNINANLTVIDSIKKNGKEVLTIDDKTTIVDNLTSTSTTSALSANQGKVLKTAIDGVISSGSNSNGNWIKYADGTMICWGEVSKTGSTKAWGSVFEVIISNFATFPQTFSSLPILSFSSNYNNTANYSGCFGGIKYSTTAITEVHIVRGTSASNKTYVVDWIAIGKWK